MFATDVAARGLDIKVTLATICKEGEGSRVEG